jgi:hypothetical protein
MKRLIAVIGVFFALAAVAVRAAGWLPLVSASTGGGGCSQATTYNGMLDSGQNSAAVTTLICGLVTDGVFAKLDVLYIFAINSSANSLVNAANPGTFTGTANGNVSTGCAGATACFSANNGWSGVDASTTIYIDTGFNPSTATPTPNFIRNSSHVMAWPYTNAASGASGGAAIGLVLAATNSSRVYPRYSDNNFYSDVNSATNATGASNNTVTGGMYLVSRTGASSVDHYKITTNQGNTSEASAAVLNGNFAVLAQRVAGSTVNFGSALQLATVSIGGGLSSTDVSNLESRLCTYLTTVHGSC